MRALSRFLFLLLCAVGVAGGETRAACGTVVLPSGIGQSDPSAVTSLNWLLTNSVDNQEAIYQIFRPLVWLDHRQNYDASMSLASDVTTPDGGRTWRLTLKPWAWSDGVPVDANDVVFTFDLIRRLGPGYVAYGVGGIPDLLEHVAALSPHRVEIRLTRRVNPDWFLRLGLGNTIRPLPEHVFRGLDPVALRARQTDPRLFAVSDGPFMLEDWQVGRHLTLVANPRFGGRKPAIERLVIDFLQGGNALQSLRAGEIDGADIPFQLWDLARALPGFRSEALDGPFGFMSMMLNFRSRHAPFLADLRVRRAIVAAIDQKQIIDLVYHGQAREIHGPVPPAMGEFLSPLARSGYPDLRHDPARATALLDQAGWKPGPDGIRIRDGHRLAFEIEVSAGVADRIIALQIIQRNLQAVGIALAIRGVEFNELLATLNGNGHDWDSIMLGWTIESFPDQQEFFSSDGAVNYGHFRDARMDALNQAVISGSGRQALDAAQDYAAEQQPTIFLPQGRISAMTRIGLDGIAAMASPNGTWAPELLTLGGTLACHDPSARGLSGQTAQEIGHAPAPGR